MRIKLKEIYKCRGNTLIEVMVSLLIIGIAASVLATGIITASNLFMRANDLSKNCASAEYDIEFRIASYDINYEQIVSITYGEKGNENTADITMSVIEQEAGDNYKLFYYLY